MAYAGSLHIDPAPIAVAYDEAVRCLSAGAPNGAAAPLRNALALIVADKGSEAARANESSPTRSSR